MLKNNTKTCSACGTSPINHQLLFVANLLDEVFEKIDVKIFNFSSTKEWLGVANFIEKIILTGMSYVGIVSFNTDIEKAITGRSKLVWEEAERRGIDMSQVVVFGKPVELYKARINNRIYFFKSLPIPPSMPQGGYDWLDDKFILFEKLLENKISAPKTKQISTLKGAREAFQELRKPVIIKPKHGSRGRHTTTNINTEEELKDAFDLAREITISMVIQEHLEGSVYRATVIDGELVGFFRGDPPQITGDGEKSIREQIEEKNATRHERLSEILINEDLINFIKRQGYTLENVLPQGTTINLSAKTGRMYGSYTKEMLSEVHPSIRTIFKKAGELVEAPVSGFDLIIEDPTQDPENQKWGIIECNSLPFIDLHYFALEGPKINLAENVWNLWKRN